MSPFRFESTVSSCGVVLRTWWDCSIGSVVVVPVVFSYNRKRVEGEVEDAFVTALSEVPFVTVDEVRTLLTRVGWY